MELNLPAYIDRIDSTEESHELIIDIYNILRHKLISPAAHREVCEELFDYYSDLCSLERRAAHEQEWVKLYCDVRNLGRAIRDRAIGTNLGRLRRTANLNLIDGILFYIKLIIVRPRERLLSPWPSVESLPDESY